MENEIVNRVANSSLVTLDLETLYTKGERVLIDLKEALFQEMILREKDFRTWVKAHDWQQYKGKFLAITCSVDAIIPVWAYMLVATKAAPYCALIIQGNLEALESKLFDEALNNINLEEYRDKMVVVKGCSKVPVPESAYLNISYQLTPLVKSIMYGEPCSTVPVYKKPRNT
jgi:hypothetical protein